MSIGGKASSERAVKKYGKCHMRVAYCSRECQAKDRKEYTEACVANEEVIGTSVID